MLTVNSLKFNHLEFTYRTFIKPLIFVLAILLITACLGSGGGGGSSNRNSSSDSGSSGSGSSGSGSSGSGSSGSGTVELSWQPPTTDAAGNTLTDLAGYTIYYGTNQSNLNQIVNINNAGLTTFILNNLSAATYYFAISAKDNNNNESSRSNVASKVVQ